MSNDKAWTGDEIRQSFLDFFAARGHTVVPSASLVPHADPTLLFTNAGMNQFKDVFLGAGARDYTRAVDTQKCMRVSGKHNDLEDVGRDTYHHTFFEMLGNWSFGDYYKKEAIGWAWELLTGVWALPKDRLWATCFEDDQGDLERDDEAAGFWRSETDIDPAHVVFFGRKDNFWEMGETGPCGPCSEIHIDRGPAFCRCQDDPDHSCGIDSDCGRFLELWNLVFIQYNHVGEGILEPLPNRHVDTGAGFERLTAILQGKASNYQTDLFTPIMDRAQGLLGHTDAQRAEQIVGYRVIADHSRAVTFLIGDGVLPENEGRGYVLRMILRRAVRFGRKLGFTEPFMDEMAQVVIANMGRVFPELEARREFILATVRQEEARFLRTLDVGLVRLDALIEALAGRDERVIPGEDGFRLYDTFGLPLEITRDVAEEHGLMVDEPGYYVALQAQRARARAADAFELVGADDLRAYQELLVDLQARGQIAPGGVEHDPYGAPVVETRLVALLRHGRPVDVAQIGDEVDLILPATCFYVESGGQVSDTGSIVAHTGNGAEPAWSVDVDDVWRPAPGLIVHKGRVVSGRPQLGDEVTAIVDYGRRMDVARNHTATHLLHRALRHTLGEHVQQAGSLVEPERLRFDFTHPTALSQKELETVVRSVNDAILARYPVTAQIESYRQALEEGVIALFGEKYGEEVRALRIGWPEQPYSRELCGGTHVDSTAEIGCFYLVAEQGIGTGVRRIEGVTGRGAIEWVMRHLRTLENTAAHLLCQPNEVEQKTLDLIDELQAARKEIARLQKHLAHETFQKVLSQVQEVAGVPLLVARVDAPEMETLLEMTDWFRDRVGSGVVVLGAVIDGQPMLVASVTPDVVERGANAVDVVRGVAEVVGGKGGGKPTLARAGGKEPLKLDQALERAAGLLEEALN